MIPPLAEWESFYIIVGSSGGRGAILLANAPEESLFAIGAAVLSLVLIGIHNAWDTVTYLAVIQREGKDQRGT